MTSPTCGELGALICALQSTPPHLPLKIYIQQKTILSEITINLTRNEDSDWAHTNNKNLYKSLLQQCTDHKWTLAGMKLKNGTQLYQEIQLATMTYAVQDLTGETPTPDKI
ncbi:hypothetical protein L208DRAFT_1384334, partial [Tricholoma matsutake]